MPISPWPPYLEEIHQRFIRCLERGRRSSPCNLCDSRNTDLFRDPVSLRNYVSLKLVSPQLVRRWCLDHDGVITSPRVSRRSNRTTMQQQNWIMLIKYWYQLPPCKYIAAITPVISLSVINNSGNPIPSAIHTSVIRVANVLIRRPFVNCNVSRRICYCGILYNAK